MIERQREVKEAKERAAKHKLDVLAAKNELELNPNNDTAKKQIEILTSTSLDQDLVLSAETSLKQAVLE